MLFARISWSSLRRITFTPNKRLRVENGSHVICEKNLVSTLAECKEIIAAVQASGKFFMTGQVCRYAPGFRLAKELIEAGRIACIQSEYAHNYANATGYEAISENSSFAFFCQLEHRDDHVSKNTPIRILFLFRLLFPAQSRLPGIAQTNHKLVPISGDR